MVSSNDDGIQKVIDDEGKYAFFMESASIEYIVERKCKVTQVGGLLDNKVDLYSSLTHLILRNIKYIIYSNLPSCTFRDMVLPWVMELLTKTILTRQYSNCKKMATCIK